MMKACGQSDGEGSDSVFAFLMPPFKKEKILDYS